MARFLIEGEWSGYRSSQQQICHREVTTDKKLADAIAKSYSITYTDGTSLILSVRPLKTGERVKDLKNGYGSLIRDCARYDVWSVQGLQDIRNQKKVDREAKREVSA